MYDIDRIGKIVVDIISYLNELKSYQINQLSDLDDRIRYHASSMVIFATLNKVIDLGTEIISSEELGAPNTYQDIMPLLAKANVINSKQADDLNEIIRKRNVLAHFYDEIKKKDLFRLIRDMSLISDFVKIVKSRVKIRG